MAEQTYERLREFMLEHPAAKRAMKQLKPGAAINFILSEDETVYHAKRIKSGAEMNKGATEQVDLWLRLGPRAVDDLLELNTSDLGTFGVEVLKHMVASRPPEEKIDIKLEAGFIGLTKRGYLKIVILGGPKVMGFLAKKGFGGLGAIKKAFGLARQRSKNFEKPKG